MPDWTPDWADVRFDQAAAQHAADECERAARVLRDTTQHRHALAQSALNDGRGPWKDHLVRRAGSVDQRCTELEAGLRGLAAALRDAAGRARSDQRAREADRQRWTVEAMAESNRAALFVAASESGWRMIDRIGTSAPT